MSKKDPPHIREVWAQVNARYTRQHELWAEIDRLEKENNSDIKRINQLRREKKNGEN